MSKRPSSTETAQRTLVTPDGRSADFPTDLPPIDDYVGPAKIEEVMFACGHKAPMFYAFSTNGQLSTVTEAFVKNKSKCPACLAEDQKKNPRCAVCGRRLRNNDQVALYLDDGSFLPDATRVDLDGKRCVIGGGCCAPEEIRPAGRWRDGKFVSREALAIENERGLAETLLGLGLIEDCAHCDKPDCEERREPYVGPADARPDAETAGG